MNFIKKLIMVFYYGDELESILKERRAAAEKELRKEKLHNLNLCMKHQQEKNRSHYSEHNCDYCNALKGRRREIDGE